VEIIMGPNIKPFPAFGPLEAELDCTVILKLGDNITTDHIMPAGNKILPLRSNIEAMSEFAFNMVDPSFPDRCKAAGNGVIVAGENYGQGSSREHAAIVPRFLGIRAKIAKSFARIHKANLINFGILPLLFVKPGDYDAIDQGDRVRLPDVRALLMEGRTEVYLEAHGKMVPLRIEVTERERKILIAGGLINAAAGA
jgi:aconitate hydratase